MAPDVAGAVQVLLDEAEIRRLLYAYCRAVDRGDLVALRALYHPDAIDDHTGVYSGPVDGFIEMLGESLAKAEVTCTRHCLSNITIELDGDVAISESYFDAYDQRQVDDRVVDEVMAGRYLDRLERREGTWRIAARRVVWDHGGSAPASPAHWHHDPSSFLFGSRSAEDPSTAWFRDRGPGQ